MYQKMEVNDKGTVSNYYDYRKCIQNLYAHDTYYGDLAGDVLKYRDEHKYVESITIDMSIPKIDVEFTENKQVSTIIRDIGAIIEKYIRAAAPKLGLSNEELSGLYDFLDKYSLFDVYSLSNTVTFNL